MKIGKQLILLAIAGSILTGCSTLSEKQRIMLTTVSVGSHEIAEEAFHDPDGTASPNASTSVPAATGGGLIPALIGSAIDARVTSKQRKKFNSTNKQYFPTVNSYTPTDIVKQLEARAVKVLRSDPFFGTRLVAKSPNYFDGEILDYGLTRLRETNGKTYLEAKMSLKIWLMGSNQKKMFEQILDISSKDAYTMRQYAEDESLTRTVFLQAMDDFEIKFIKLLNTKLGR